MRFSPYSRGWSLFVLFVGREVIILPVFAGMVPDVERILSDKINSPRIRGDGPS